MGTEGTSPPKDGPLCPPPLLQEDLWVWLRRGGFNGPEGSCTHIGDSERSVAVGDERKEAEPVKENTFMSSMASQISVCGPLCPSCVPHLDTKSPTVLVHARVVSRLDYYNALHMGLIRRIQQVQNMAGRLLSGVRRPQHISPTLAALHWLPVRFRASFKVMVLTCKSFDDIGP